MLAHTCWQTIPCIESCPLFRMPKMGHAQAGGYEMEHTNLNTGRGWVGAKKYSSKSRRLSSE